MLLLMQFHFSFRSGRESIIYLSTERIAQLIAGSEPISTPIKMTASQFRVLVSLVTILLAASVCQCGLFEEEYDASEMVNKSPEQILEMRGYGFQTHYARTPDGYHVHVVRIINPAIRAKHLKRPVIFNHGLLESATIWLINSWKVRPLDMRCSVLNQQLPILNRTAFVNGPMMMANYGYDVWLMSMRGTDWSLRHDTLSPEDKKFWDYSLDDFALGDVPTVVDYVRAKTGSPKVGYVGHSQATFSVFGLLSTRPQYADVIEPVIAVAPVAYMEHITSVARVLFLGTLEATDKDTHGPFPKEAKSMRNLFSDVCGNKKRPLWHSACSLLDVLISGKGKGFLRGYWNHLPYNTSLKVLRHFGQLVKYKRFMMHDYGNKDNMKLYNTVRSPSYPIARIRSRSLCLFSTKSDSLSPPDDVAHFTSQLSVRPFKSIFINKDFNHMDLIVDKQAGELVFFPMLEILEHFESRSGTGCSGESEHDSEAVQHEHVGHFGFDHHHNQLEQSEGEVFDLGSGQDEIHE